MIMSCAACISSCSTLFFCSKAVIGVGVEEEDRMDQWIEDAESVSPAVLMFCLYMYM